MRLRVASEVTLVLGYITVTYTPVTEVLPRMNDQQDIDIAIVGSGFSGLAMATRLKRSGRDDFVICERAREVGGTWRENTYPGCRCDVPSHVYSFSFAPNPEWTSTFSAQPEIRDYLRRVAAEEGLLEHVRFGCEVESARWDADAAPLDAADLERPAAGPGADRRRRPAARAEAARHPGPGRLRGDDLSLGDLGPRPRAGG